MRTPGPSVDVELWSRLLLVCCGLLVGFAIAELAVRALDVEPRMLDDPGTGILVLSDNPDLRYRFQPNYHPPANPPPRSESGRRFGNPLDYFHTNSLGFRDREFRQERRDGTQRIIAVGDSITAGNGIADVEKVYTRRLETLLNRRDDETRYEVYNMGVSGYETHQEIETLRVYGLEYDPDVVLVQFCLNDFTSRADGGAWQKLRRDVEPRQYDYWLTVGPALKRSRLAFVLYYRLLGFLDQQAPTSIDLPEQPDLRGLELLSELQAEHGFRAVVFVVPIFNREFTGYGHGHLHRKIRRRAERFPNITFVDLLPRFRARPESVEEMTLDGLHPSPTGHAILAQMLVEELRRLEILADDRVAYSDFPTSVAPMALTEAAAPDSQSVFMY